jgi:uncharacterized protein (DUF58 family)
MSEPEASDMAGRSRPAPTARGIAAAVLGALLLAGGIVWRYPGVFGLGLALLALAGLALVTVLGRAPIALRRTVSPLEVTRFEPCEATLTVRRWASRLPVDIADTVDGRPVSVPEPSRQVPARVGYRIPTERRGVRAVGPLVIVRRGVAGLATSRTVLGGVLAVRVLPRIRPVRGMPRGVSRGQAGVDELVARGGTDLVGLREYQPGDDLRRLHWATSARAGRLMVREDADPSTAHVTLLLDDRADSHPDGDMEEAVEVVASLAVAAAEGGHAVRVSTMCGRLDAAAPASLGRDGGFAARDLASALADVAVVDSTVGDGTVGDGTVGAAPVPLPPSELDIVIAVTGARADLGPLVAQAGRAALGVVAVVDPTVPSGQSTWDGGGVTVLRGRDCSTLLAVWDATVVG